MQRRKHQSELSSVQRRKHSSEFSSMQRRKHSSEFSSVQRRKHSSEFSSLQRRKHSSEFSSVQRRKHSSEFSSVQRRKHSSEFSSIQRRKHSSEFSSIQRRITVFVTCGIMIINTSSFGQVVCRISSRDIIKIMCVAKRRHMSITSVYLYLVDIYKNDRFQIQSTKSTRRFATLAKFTLELNLETLHEDNTLNPHMKIHSKHFQTTSMFFKAG